MPRKKLNDKAILPIVVPPMSHVPPAEQDEFRDRYGLRQDIRDAMKQLSIVFKAWVQDIVLDADRFRWFNAGGHHGEYEEEYPKDTLARKLQDLGWTEEQLKKVAKDATPIDLMTSDELEYVLQRVQMMLDWFERNPQGGSYQRACRVYEAVGLLIRQEVRARTSHAPEQFPTPHVIITGVEKSERMLPQPYRVSLFPDEEVPS